MNERERRRVCSFFVCFLISLKKKSYLSYYYKGRVFGFSMQLGSLERLRKRRRITLPNKPYRININHATRSYEEAEAEAASQ